MDETFNSEEAVRRGPRTFPQHMSCGHGRDVVKRIPEPNYLDALVERLEKCQEDVEHKQ